MLAFHSRIARRPAGRWVDELIGQSALLECRGEAEDCVVATCGVYNQAALVFFLLGEVAAAQRVLDMQNAFLDQRRPWLPRNARLAATNQIVVNEIRIERATGSVDTALARVRAALDEARHDSWELLKREDTEQYRTQRADLQVELCKLLVKTGDIAAAEECVAIGLSDEAGWVLRGVGLECAAMIYLANSKSTPFERLLARLSPDEPARRIFLLRRVLAEAAQGGTLAAVRLAPKLAMEIKGLATRKFDYIDYLHFIDFTCDLFRSAGLGDRHREALRCLQEGARRARDIVFYCSSSARLETFGADKRPNGRFERPRALRGKCFPVFGSAEARVKIRTDQLLQQLAALQEPRLRQASAGAN
jgi:hypothetical protein